MKKRDVGILRGNDRQKFAVRLEEIAQNVRRSGRQNQIGPGGREVVPFFVFINVLDLKIVRPVRLRRLAGILNDSRSKSRKLGGPIKLRSQPYLNLPLGVSAR